MIRKTHLWVASKSARGWQANKKHICAKLVVLGLCPKKKNHPLCGWSIIDGILIVKMCFFEFNWSHAFYFFKHSTEIT